MGPRQDQITPGRQIEAGIPRSINRRIASGRIMPLSPAAIRCRSRTAVAASVRPQGIHPRDRLQTFINHLGG
jgi:hypothetical protein